MTALLVPVLAAAASDPFQNQGHRIAEAVCRGISPAEMDRLRACLKVPDEEGVTGYLILMLEGRPRLIALCPKDGGLRESAVDAALEQSLRQAGFLMLVPDGPVGYAWTLDTERIPSYRSTGKLDGMTQEEFASARVDGRGSLAAAYELMARIKDGRCE